MSRLRFPAHGANADGFGGVGAALRSHQRGREIQAAAPQADLLERRGCRAVAHVVGVDAQPDAEVAGAVAAHAVVITRRIPVRAGELNVLRRRAVALDVEHGVAVATRFAAAGDARCRCTHRKKQNQSENRCMTDVGNGARHSTSRTNRPTAESRTSGDGRFLSTAPTP